jgi:DNA repair protein RecO (recombination protein O)
MGIVETEAIVLRSYRLAEADKIVVCLTREAGVVRGVAHGARRLKSRFGASFEAWTHISLSYFEKEGRELVSIRGAEILRSHFSLASASAEAFAALEYLSELLIEFAPPHEPFEKLFRMAKACIEALATHPNEPLAIRAIVQYFEVWTLKLSGFFPDLRYCTACRHRFVEREGIYLDFENIVRCAECAGNSAGANNSTRSSFVNSNWDELRVIERSTPMDFARRERPVHTEVSVLTQRLIARALERTPRGQTSFVRA